MSNLVFQNGKIVSYGKNESRKNMNYIDYGLSYFNADVFSNFREKSTFDLSAVCMELIKNRKLDGYEVFQRFFEIGSMQGISEFSNYLRKGFDDL
jgi:NDP-sugar pyrophosphorylase family protein